MEMANVKSAEDGSGTGPRSGELETLLAASTGWRLSMAGRLVRGEAEKALAAFGLRNRHFGVLLVLAAIGSAPQGEVARRAMMDKSTMVAVVDDLEALKLVERRRNHANRRAYELVLTTAGQETLTEARARVAEVEARALAPLDDAERAALHHALGRLLAASGLA